MGLEAGSAVAVLELWVCWLLLNCSSLNADTQGSLFHTISIPLYLIWLELLLVPSFSLRVCKEKKTWKDVPISNSPVTSVCLGCVPSPTVHQIPASSLAQWLRGCMCGAGSMVTVVSEPFPHGSVNSGILADVAASVCESPCLCSLFWTVGAAPVSPFLPWVLPLLSAPALVLHSQLIPKPNARTVRIWSALGCAYRMYTLKEGGTSWLVQATKTSVSTVFIR